MLVLQNLPHAKVLAGGTAFFLDTMPCATVNKDSRIISSISKAGPARKVVPTGLGSVEQHAAFWKKSMLRVKTRSAVAATVFSLVILWPGAMVPLYAQDKPVAAPAIVPKTAETKLSDQETRGEGFFLQRCSLCHLPRKLKFGSPATAGPVLTGVFKEVDADQMKILRTHILKGGPGMPGFQFDLEPKEIDDLIAFLKTL